MINSKQKGKKGELEAAHKLNTYGFSCRRGQQYSGICGEDVVGLPNIHIEVKRNERLNIDDAVNQSISDSSNNQLPIVMHRKNRKRWLVTMCLDDWMKLYKNSSFSECDNNDCNQ